VGYGGGWGGSEFEQSRWMRGRSEVDQGRARDQGQWKPSDKRGGAGLYWKVFAPRTSGDLAV
jgi:hypothetical protein